MNPVSYSEFVQSTGPIDILDQILSGTFQNKWIGFTQKDFSFKVSKKNDKIIIDFLDKPMVIVKHLLRMQTELISITIDKDYIYVKTGLITIPISRKDLENV